MHNLMDAWAEWEVWKVLVVHCCIVLTARGRGTDTLNTGAKFVLCMWMEE